MPGTIAYAVTANTVRPKPVLCDEAGALILSGGSAGGGAATYTATPPTLVEGGTAGATYDERSRLRVTSGPAESAVPVTTSDSTNFTGITRGLYIGGAGNVTAVINGVAVLFTAVPAGTILPIRATRVNAAGTSATAMVALF